MIAHFLFQPTTTITNYKKNLPQFLKNLPYSFYYNFHEDRYVICVLLRDTYIIEPHAQFTLIVRDKGLCLSCLAVMPKRRGQGIALNILKRLLTTAEKYKIPITLDCRDELIPLYEKAGFTQVPLG